MNSLQNEKNFLYKKLKEQINTLELKWEAYLYILPALLFLILVVGYPLVKVVLFSLREGVFISPNPEFVLFDNFIELFLHDSAFITALINTFIYTVSAVSLHILLGLGFALLLNQPIHPIAQLIFRSILILPWIFTAAVIAIDWQLVLDPLGVVNYFLKYLGVIDYPLDWFGNYATAFPTLVVVTGWRLYPLIMVSLLAGLQGIPKYLYESAKIDGANSWQCFRHVTLPQLKPVLLSMGVLDVIWTFRLFPLVWLTTGGGPGHRTDMLSTYTYKVAFEQFNYGKASAIALIIALVTSTLAYFYVRRQQ